MIKNIFND